MGINRCRKRERESREREHHLENDTKLISVQLSSNAHKAFSPGSSFLIGRFLRTPEKHHDAVADNSQHDFRNKRRKDQRRKRKHYKNGNSHSCLQRKDWGSLIRFVFGLDGS